MGCTASSRISAQRWLTVSPLTMPTPLASDSAPCTIGLQSSLVGCASRVYILTCAVCLWKAQRSGRPNETKSPTVSNAQQLCVPRCAELLLAAVGTLVFSCVVYFPLKLGGLWVTWWLCYFCTLSIGIGALPAMRPCALPPQAGLPMLVSVCARRSSFHRYLLHEQLTSCSHFVCFGTTRRHWAWINSSQNLQRSLMRYLLAMQCWHTWWLPFQAPWRWPTQVCP